MYSKLPLIRLVFIASLFGLWAPAIQSAPKELIFSAAPTEATEKALAQYTPLMEYLSKEIGVKIRVEMAPNFIEYSQKLIENYYDITFDGPHLTGWRMQRFNHKVLAKFPGDLRFIVLVRDDADISKVRKLAGKKVCGVGIPNLMTMGFLDLFADPASTPLVVNVKDFGDAVGCAQRGDGVAAVTRDKFWIKLTVEKRQGLKVLFHSPALWPERAFSVSDRVDAKTREKLRAALLSPNANIAGAALLKNYKMEKFVPATDKEYQGYGRLLRHVWGFHEQSGAM